ncbi:Hypothetical predicted protein [Paramuricea clavata]|uniref:Uncharacterized protein n=1 Tax=Paramuricea clavata TaxID=317549 RepID=A0A6S7KHL3_PARCT|nr:Hypothetical predicted protein [Paramuricea clavata]
MNQMSSKILELEEAQEDLKLYSRRDCLEFQGVPEMPSENTDELVTEMYAVYHNKGRLRGLNSSNFVGISQSVNKLYIFNESLTPKAKELFYKVREFPYGKSYVKKTDTNAAVSFKSMKEFELFSANFTP